MLKNTKEIEKWLKIYGIKNYIVNDDFSVDVNDDVIFRQYPYVEEFAVKFGKVNGNFICSENKLKSLRNSPSFVGRDFDCSRNLLTSLRYGPKIVKGNYDCKCNYIETLKYSPKEIGKDFNCRNNPILALENDNINFKGNFLHFGSHIKELEEIYYYEHIEISHEQLKKIYLKFKLENSFIKKPMNKTKVKKL